MSIDKTTLDDIFDEDADEIGLETKGWQKISDARLKEGYREGLASGHENTLQRGFNDGFTQSTPAMLSLGKMRGVLCGILGYYQMTKTENISSIHLERLERLVQTVAETEEEWTTNPLLPKREELNAAISNPISNEDEHKISLINISLGGTEDESTAQPFERVTEDRAARATSSSASATGENSSECCEKDECCSGGDTDNHCGCDSRKSCKGDSSEPARGSTLEAEQERERKKRCRILTNLQCEVTQLLELLNLQDLST